MLDYKLEEASACVAHRALSDAEALEALFISTPLQELLPSITIKNGAEIMSWLSKKKTQHQRQLQPMTPDEERKKLLMRAFLGLLSFEEVGQLAEQKISCTMIEEWRAGVTSAKDFSKVLKKNGVRNMMRKKFVVFFFKDVSHSSR